ncbi:kinase [Streptomyces sp. CB02959]|uniref:AAA family ATPase n=1 Tax=Streptomyces sp. CB02959 TaxID=2020330 RepID=UPI000C27778F|nr:AAA family ATPase [Streptomyces sp. CB02959]PJN32328.1 kinase [Streptomyces sp. CB02959]
MTMLFLTVGLPEAGKTTRARQLAEEHGVLRLTPDDWMIPLFGKAEADGKRDVLEGRMLWLALEAVKLATNMVVDYGCWYRDDRSAIRWLVEAEGACLHLVYLPVNEESQRARVAHRRATAPEETFPMTETDILHGRAHFEERDAAELHQELRGDVEQQGAGLRTW